MKNKGCVYRFDVAGLVLKQQARLSMSTLSSSVDNYDAREMVVRFNETFCKAVEEAREEETYKKIEEEVTARLTPSGDRKRLP